MAELKHLTGIKNLSRQEIENILDLSEGIEDVITGKIESKPLKDKVLATFFYEPSTRTRLAFESAMIQLGGSVISVAEAKTSTSVWKGETLPDTIRTIENYADIIVLRHFEAGAAEIAAEYSKVPIINAGDGPNEHPTQTLLDLLTIKKECGTLDGLKVVVCGDLKHTRSTNSLALGLSNFDVEFNFVSPPDFRTKQWILDIVKERGCSYIQTEDLEESVKDADVIYMCRIQKERMDQNEYERIAGVYDLTRAMLEKSSKTIAILHHLPRVGELAEDVDSYPGAAYFRQTLNGVFVRGALLVKLLNLVPEELKK